MYYTERCIGITMYTALFQFKTYPEGRGDEEQPQQASQGEAECRT